MDSVKAQQIANHILLLYTNYGHADYIGEPVSQIEHMCQCAQLAQAAGYDEEVILAAFFHDIGHLLENETTTQQMDGFGVVDHEKLGADYLWNKGFSTKICSLVSSHVVAKRYLTFKDARYYQQLSPASKQTLIYQGGPMLQAEAIAFEADPLHPLYIQLRLWDEQAKLQHQPLPPLTHYAAMMMRQLETGEAFAVR